MCMILVVEDTQDSYDLIADTLGDRHTLVHARTGPEGIKLAVRVRPDLILLDICLPELDGLSVVRRLRGMAEFRATPIIAITANAMPQDRENCLAAGCNEYLSKPIAVRHLTELVNRILPPESRVPAGCGPNLQPSQETPS